MAKKKESVGFVCSTCEAGLRVKRTTPRPGRIYRRRECPICGRKISTNERLVGDRGEEAVISALSRISIGDALKFSGLLDGLPPITG